MWGGESYVPKFFFFTVVLLSAQYGHQYENSLDTILFSLPLYLSRLVYTYMYLGTAPGHFGVAVYIHGGPNSPFSQVFASPSFTYAYVTYNISLC